MSDNPKLTIELVEKGGSTGQGNPGVAAGSSTPAVYDSTGSFHEKITNTGIQAPSSPVQESRMNPVTEAQQNIPQQQSTIFSNPDGFKVNPGKENAVEIAVNALLRDSPDIAPKEVAAILGIKPEYATQLIDRARANTAPVQPAVIPQSVPQSVDWTPDPSNPYDGPPSNFINRQTTRAPATSSGEEIDPVTGISLTDTETRNQLRRDFEGFEEPTDIGGLLDDVMPQQNPASAPSQPTEVPSNSSSKDVASSINLILNATRMNNPITSQVVSALPLISSELGAFGSAITAAAPPIAAVAGLAAATIGASFNEANRAVSLSREFSPDVALADAFSELRQLRADLNTANTLGPAAADYIENTSRISTAAQGIRDNIGKPIIENLNTQLNGLANILEGLNKNNAGVATGSVLGTGLAGATDYAIGLGAAMSGLGPYGFLVPGLLKFFADKQTKDEQFDLYTWFNDAVPMMPLPVPFNAMDVAREQPAGVQFEAIPGLQLN